MTKTNSTRKALFMSMISLLICFSMLVGTTFAWFTDSVTSANNVIKSGNLDIELEYWDGTNWTDIAGKSDILTNTLWEPGVTEVAYLRITNAGSLALKYQLGINIVSEEDGTNQAGESFRLSDYIMFGVVEGVNGQTGAYANREDAVAAVTGAKRLNEGYTKASSLAAGGPSVYLALVVYMPTEVGNIANHDGEDIPQIDLGININAYQVTSEPDDFGSDYDASAAGSYELTHGFNNDEDLANFASDPDDPSSSGLRVENGKAVVASGGATYTADVNVALNAATVSFETDITSMPDSSSININAGTESSAKVPFRIERGSAKVYYVSDEEEEYVGKLDGTVLTISHTYSKDEDNYLVISTVFSDGKDELVYEKKFVSDNNITVKWQIPSVDEPDAVTLDDFVLVQEPVEIKTGAQLIALFESAKDGSKITMPQGFNSSEAPLTETIMITGNITVDPNGMYLVSSAPATFTVAEGASLTIGEGSFTVKNIATEGAAVLVDGGSFTMQGGSFDAHTAVRTTEGKSSTVAMTAGWSNRVTVAFHSKGNDTINVSGGSIYSSAESVKTTAGTHLNFNMSGGLLSSKTTQYSAAVNLQGTATVNMTGGKIENTYSSGYNGSSAIQVNVAPSTINLSGTAALSSNGVAVMLGSHWDPPAVHEEKITFNMSGNSSISATSVMGFGIRYAQDNCDVTIAGNAKVNATYQAIQFNTNNYVYTNSTLTVAENATITSTAGRIGGGYGIAANGYVTVTGGTINGSTAGIASFQEGAAVIVDNSTSGTPISINKVDIADVVDYTVAGDPVIG